jgi:hypothetical protein
MIKKTQKLGYHPLIISLVVVAALASSYTFFHPTTSYIKLAISDATHQRLLTVHPLPNGLVSINFVHNYEIAIVNKAAHKPPAIINGNIGDTAASSL